MTERLSVRELSKLPAVERKELTVSSADPAGKLPAGLDSSSYCM